LRGEHRNREHGDELEELLHPLEIDYTPKGERDMTQITSVNGSQTPRYPR
jgi:hypothetical protein